jgi:hypothetical protein
MKRLILAMMLGWGISVYGIWAGSIHKQKLMWVPPEKGTPTVKMLSNKILQLQKEFKKRFPEYTLSYDEYGILKEISAPANVVFSTNPLRIGTYTLESLFTDFEDLFGIGTECLHCYYPSFKSYKGLPVFLFNTGIIGIREIPEVSGNVWDPKEGYKGTWSLIINYPYQLKDLDLIPTITGSQAVEIAIKGIYNWATWPDSTYQSEFPSLKEYIDKYSAMGFSTEYLNKWYNSDKISYEYMREYYKSRGIKPSSQSSSMSPEDTYELCIFIHENGKPYLVWYVVLERWKCYIDAKMGKLLYGDSSRGGRIHRLP